MLRCAVLLAGFLFAPSLCVARTWHILPDGTGDAPTIQAGIDSSAAGDIIELADGTYTGFGNRDILFRGRAVTVRSASGSAELCRIDCGYETPGFYFWSGEGPDSRLENVTILNTLARLDVTGAIYTENSSPTIVGCVVTSHQRLGSGWSACIWASGSTVIEGCTVSNSEGYGLRLGGQATATDCVVTQNEHAGVLLSHFSGLLANVVTSGNGRGIECSESTPRIEGCTVVDNGIGVYVNTSVVDIVSSLICFNSSAGAPCNFPPAVVSLACSIVHGNGWPGDCLDGQLDTNGNGVEAPLFCDFDAGDYHLRSDSPGAPDHSGGCGLIGALPVGCGPVAVEAMSWGKVKGAYR